MLAVVVRAAEACSSDLTAAGTIITVSLYVSCVLGWGLRDLLD